MSALAAKYFLGHMFWTFALTFDICIISKPEMDFYSWMNTKTEDGRFVYKHLAGNPPYYGFYIQHFYLNTHFGFTRPFVNVASRNAVTVHLWWKRELTFSGSNPRHMTSKCRTHFQVVVEAHFGSVKMLGEVKRERLV